MSTLGPFTNKALRPKRRDKPHIVFLLGLWRVSPLLRGNYYMACRWEDAHKLTTRLNQPIIDKYFAPLRKKELP